MSVYKQQYTNLSLHGELSWGVRGDCNEEGAINALDTNGISSMYFDGSAPVLNGLTNPNQEQEKLMILFYVGSGSLTVSHASTSAAANKRIILPYATDIIVYPNETVILFYDSVEYCWRFLSKSTHYIPQLISTEEVRLNEIKLTNAGGITITSSGDLNNLNVNSSIVRISAASSISGFVASAEDSGKLIFLQNVNTSDIVIKNNNTNSSIGNRIITGTGADFNLHTGASTIFIYDVVSEIWRMFSGSGTGGPAGGNLSYSVYSYGNITTNSNLNLSLLDQGAGVFKHTNTNTSTITLINGIPGKRYKLYSISNGVQYSFTATGGIYYPSDIVPPSVSANNKTDLYNFECIAPDRFLCVSYAFNFNISNIQQSDVTFVNEVSWNI